MDWNKLAEPFPAEDIEWRVQNSGMKNGKGWAMVLAYVTNRAIQQRLDDVVSPENWKNEYKEAPDGGVLCGISIKVEDEWVTKYDGAENTKVEAIKGGLSGAMKRAAVQWGIGRYLYKLETTYVEVGEKGKNWVSIKYKDGNTEKVYKGYWNDPSLPDWALPAARLPKLTNDEIKQLLAVAKAKGTENIEEATVLINEAIKTANFTQLPSERFPIYLKMVQDVQGIEPKEPF